MNKKENAMKLLDKLHDLMLRHPDWFGFRRV